MTRALFAALAAVAVATAPASAADVWISRLPSASSLAGNENVLIIQPDNKTLEKASASVLTQLSAWHQWKGAWNSTTNYVLNDAVSYNGSSYIAIAANNNAQPDISTSSWSLIAQAGSNGTGTGTVTSVTCGNGLSGGTFTVSGTCGLSAPVSVANGGTGATTGSGTVIDNLSGWTGTGFVVRSGAGAYGFLPAPLTVANGGTGITSGTSGAINCWTSGTAMGVSGVLTQYALMVGGGAGACPQPLASLGTSTTVLHGNASGAPSYSSVVYGDIASAAIATGAQFAANTASVLNTPNAIWSSAAPLTLTYAATVTPDLSTGSNFALTLTGNATIAAPINAKAGQSGAIQINQDATGSRLITWPSVFKWASGTQCVLSTSASASDYVFYYVFSSSVIVTSCMLNVH